LDISNHTSLVCENSTLDVQFCKPTKLVGYPHLRIYLNLEYNLVDGPTGRQSFLMTSKAKYMLLVVNDPILLRFDRPQIELEEKQLSALKRRFKDGGRFDRLQIELEEKQLSALKRRFKDGGSNHTSLLGENATLDVQFNKPTKLVGYLHLRIYLNLEYNLIDGPTGGQSFLMTSKGKYMFPVVNDPILLRFDRLQIELEEKKLSALKRRFKDGERPTGGQSFLMTSKAKYMFPVVNDPVLLRFDRLQIELEEKHLSALKRRFKDGGRYCNHTSLLGENATLDVQFNKPTKLVGYLHLRIYLNLEYNLIDGPTGGQSFLMTSKGKYMFPVVNDPILLRFDRLQIELEEEVTHSKNDLKDDEIW
ncbi:hypothetical protein Tco_1040851, partial [Tanacetum coccineum]